MKKCVLLSICLLATLFAATFSADAQDIVKTVVGGGPNGIPGVDANLFYPYQTAVDSSGNVYVASEQQNRIFKINSSGIISVVAGNGVAGYSGDSGPAVSANLYNPRGIAVDSANPANIYIADFNNCLVRKVTGSTGIITTIAGLVTVPATGNPYATCGYSGNGGAANQAKIYGPTGLALDPRTNDLFITEFYNGIVRKVAGGTATGTISLYAGSGGSPTAGNNCQGSSPYGDGASATAGFLCYPQAISLDTSASPVNAFISESVSGGHCDIREVVGSSKDIYQVAGSYKLGCGFTDNVTATSGQLYDPWQTHVSVSGSTTTIQVADYDNARIRQFTLTYSAGAPVPGTITTIAGKGQGGFCGDGGSALNACMSPVGLAYDSSGNYYIGDYGAERLRKVTKSTGYISTLAGWGPNGGTNTTYSDPVGVLNASGVPALYYPVGVSADPNSSKVYVSGYSGQAVYVWDNSTNEISDLAGSGVAGFAGDGGLAASVGTELYNPADTAKDSSGNVYIADFNNCVIRQVNSSGDITTVAGGSSGSKNGCGYTGDSGTAVNAQFNGIYAIAIDGANNIYIADYYNCAIRKIDGSTTIVSTIAGGLGCGFTGDNGPATKAKIYYPAGIAVDGAGNIYFSDYQNQRIREIVALTGNIQTIAGTGNAGFNGDGQANAHNLYYPVGVAADANGNVFVADQDNYILRWISPTGQMLTFAGTPSSAGFSGDGGPALSAQFYQPNGIAQDNKGNFYTADYQNFRIRQVSAFSGYGLSTDHITFDVQQVGTSSDFQALAISAIGPTKISAIKVSNGFSEIDDCVGSGVVLNAGETCEVDIYFTPASGQTYNGTLTISSDAFLPGNPNTVALTGIGGGLSITGKLNYYSVPLNTVAYNTFTLHNNGPAVTIKKIYLAFPSGYYFGSGGSCPRGGGVLAAHSTCSIPLNFSPHRVGEQDNTVVVQSSDPASPLLFQPYGNGTEVKLSVSSINFGTITHGTKATQNVTISNTGTASYTLTTSITGTGFSILTTGNTCGSSVAGGASCVVPIQYAPTATGSSTGSVKFATNGGSSPSVALTGVAD